MPCIATTDVAAHLRKLLKPAFPGVKFSVRCNSSTWIDVEWTDGPNEEDVKKITRPLRGSHFDKHTNQYVRVEPLTVIVKGVTMTGDPLVDGIHTRRGFSVVVIAQATELWQRYNDGFDIEVCRHHWQDPILIDGADIRSGPVDSQIQEIAAKVVLAQKPTTA